MDNLELIKEAKLARLKAYAPYSKFLVGAALLCSDGTVFHGANVENSSYPLCMCAERNALYHAYMNGYHKDDFVALALIGDTERPISPCGACRQVMQELLPSNAKVIMSNIKGDIKVVEMKEILPFAFDKEDLQWNRDL